MDEKDFQFLKSPVSKKDAINIAQKFGQAKTKLAPSNPSLTDDSSKGYKVGSFWFNTSSVRVFICVDSTINAANWQDLTSTATVGSFRGFWNASTNSPSIQNGSGSNGDYFFVSTSGSQDLGAGSISFGTGDMVINDSGVWSKIPAQNLITSVFGRLGNITAQNGDYAAEQISFAFEGFLADNMHDALLEVRDQSKSKSFTFTNSTSMVCVHDFNLPTIPHYTILNTQTEQGEWLFPSDFTANSLTFNSNVPISVIISIFKNTNNA